FLSLRYYDRCVCGLLQETVMKAHCRGRRSRCRVVPIALSVVCLVAGCSSPEPVRSEAVRPVKTMVVDAADGARVRSFSGRVEAAKTAELAFAVPGLLIKFPVTEGQSVRQNEVIAQLREDEYRARLQTLQGQMDQARATLRSLQAGERPEERLRRE